MSSRIVVIDDSDEMLELLSELLDAVGHTVVTFTGLGTTVEEIVEAEPDLLVIDALLPGPSGQLSGWDYLRLARHHERLHGVPVLVCSADVAELRARRAEFDRLGRVDVLEKPFGIDDLERAVSNLLDAAAPPIWDDEIDVVLVADERARLVDASTAALRLLRLSLADLRRLSVGDIVAQDREWTEREWERYLRERRWKGAVVLRTAEGDELPAHADAEIVDAARTTWHISRLSLA